MTESNIAISVNGVYKDFKLPHEKAGSFKNIFTSMFHAVSASRAFTKQHALKDINFNVKKGEFFGIVGRNGSGKSTLLKIIAGIYQPSKGHIAVNGKLVPFIELGVGFNAELTGRENVYLNGALLGFSKKQIDSMYDSIVSFAELSKFMDQKLKNYSSGMQVRLAFSLAIRAETDILLVDEVLAVGDADFQRKCFSYFRKLKRDKKTVIFVSHDMNSVAEYCDRAILIEKSRLIKEGPAQEIANDYKKMFIVENNADSKDASDKTKRWGDKSIVYKNIEMLNQVSTLDPIKIQVTANFKKEVDSPVFGFSIKNLSGQTLLGTNTQLIGRNFGIIKKGSQIKLEWNIPHIFNNGSYFVDLAAVKNSTEVCDWIEDALEFEVFRDETNPYIVNPPVSVEINE